MATDDRSRKYVEGPDAAQKFYNSMRRILSVPKTELVKREAAYQKTRRAKRSRRPAKVDADLTVPIRVAGVMSLAGSANLKLALFDDCKELLGDVRVMLFPLFVS